MTQPKAKYHAETIIKTEKFEYTWVLKNFRHFYGPAGFYIDSPVFSMIMDGVEHKWSAKLYPSGNPNQSADQCVRISITLNAVQSQQQPVLQNPTTAHFICNFSSLTSDERITKSLNANYYHINYHNIINTQYFDNFGNRENLDNFLSDDNLTIEFVIYLRKSTCSGSDTPVLEVKAKETPILHHHSGFSDFKRLFQNTELSDLTIIIGDKQITAHKCILAARSPVFSAMFHHDTEEKKQNVVRIPDIDYKIMIEVLRFTYCEEVENIEEIAMDLLVAADKYDINDLRVWCEKVLVTRLSMENIGEMLIFVDTYLKATELRAAVFKFIASNLNELKKSQEFKKMMESVSSSILSGLICVIRLNA